ncbi:hypothetical protein GO986_09360 [Deinococcus sp. HMF7620]|uniref:VOC domain-containing protein n=1 Tax=Deinococcus arboris TaxID=2682977 RepID=A0A7C9HRL9_9DEIO|nr:VOC family protein [Deinococcus arboris]MVN86972.1 hypothetical protein [Deinococcus arboris]
MQTRAISLMTLSQNPAEGARFYQQHFGFLPTAELPWFVSLQHPDHPQFNLDLIQKDHEAAGPFLQGKRTAAVMLALVVDDVDAEAVRLQQAGLTFLMPPTAEPWGQKRLQVLGPDDVVVEVLQMTAPDQDWLKQQV